MPDLGPDGSASRKSVEDLTSEAGEVPTSRRLGVAESDDDRPSRRHDGHALTEMPAGEAGVAWQTGIGWS
jgi:hypothetical protein